MDKPWCSSDLALFQFLAVTYRDMLPEPPLPAIYTFGQAPQNTQQAIVEATAAWCAVEVTKVLFCGGEDCRDSFGRVLYSPKKYEELLLEEGIPSIQLYGILREDPSHTHTEARQLALHCKKMKYRDVYVTGSVPHQMRAFAESIWATVNYYPELRVWSRPPHCGDNWHERIILSQSQEDPKPRIETLADELEKMKKYYQKGDLLSVEEMLAYLEWRDKSVN